MLGLEEKYLPENWREGEAQRYYWIFSRFLVLIILVVLFYLLVSLFPPHIPLLEPLSVSDRIRLTGIWSSLLLTFALLVIYKGIGETQSKQVEEIQQQRGIEEDLAEIQDKQQDLMELQYEPIIEVIGPETYGGFAAYKLRNIGRGPAKNLKIRIHIKVPDLDLSVTTGPDQLSHVEGLGNLESPDGMDDLSAEELSEISSLTPNQTGVLAAEIHTYGPHRVLGIPPDGRSRGVGELSRYLSDEGGFSVSYQVEITFDHQMVTRGKGHYYLPTKRTYVDSEIAISTFLDPERSDEVNPRRSSHLGFEVPGINFEEIGGSSRQV